MSLNDPNWGRGGSRGPQGPGGGNQGPPDLDELWRNFNRRLGELSGQRRRGGDAPPGAPVSWHFGGGAGLLVALVLVVWLASGFYIVEATSRAAVLTFGKFAEEVGDGLHWRLPWPIQSHEIVNLTRVRTLEVGYRNNNLRNKVDKESLMLTEDENIVDLQFAVQYTVKNARDYLFKVRRPDDSAMQIAETAIREIIGKHRMDDILYQPEVAGKAKEVSRAVQEDIANRTHKLMQEIHDRYGTGIAISKVTIQNAQPPEEVQAAFSDAQKAGQDGEKQKNEGQAYANDVIPRAGGTASRLKQEAEGYKQRVIANAEGDASRFKAVLAEYAKAPQVTRERIYIETLQQVLSSSNKIVMDYRGSGNLLYLPLDKLMQQSATGASSEGQPAPRAAPEPAPAPESGPRSRDTLRNRDRESAR
jgi:modulator of FtsH protease HflK